jgi:hypothetical protein
MLVSSDRWITRGQEAEMWWRENKCSCPKTTTADKYRYIRSFCTYIWTWKYILIMFNLPKVRLLLPTSNPFFQPFDNESIIDLKSERLRPRRSITHTQRQHKSQNLGFQRPNIVHPSSFYMSIPGNQSKATHGSFPTDIRSEILLLTRRSESLRTF